MTTKRATRGWQLLGRTVAAAGVVAVMLVGQASADAPDADEITSIDSVVNGDGSVTVTISGTWIWPTHKTDCNLDRYAVGWEVDWNDPDQPGNPIGATTVDVGALAANAYNPLDNTVDYKADPPRCGTYDNGLKYNVGTWGPISHTYAPGTDPDSIRPCVVTYDIHKTKDGGIKAGDLIAGGTNRNKDNSVEANAKTPAGNQCAVVTLPSSLTLRKVVINDNGGTATVNDFTLTATEVGELTPLLNGTDGVSGAALGDFLLGESGPSGYTASAWDCGSAPVVDGVVSVFQGQNVVCTITNDDDPPATTTTQQGSQVPLPGTGDASALAALIAALVTAGGAVLVMTTRRSRTA